MVAKKKLIDITDQEIEAIYDAGKEVKVDFIKMLIDKINQLETMVQELEAQISKNSHNSNKPPTIKKSDPVPIIRDKDVKLYHEE